MNPLGPIFTYWRDFVKSYRSIASFRWLVVGALVGLFSGLTAIVFFGAIEWGKFLIQNQLAGIVSPHPAGEHLFHAHPDVYRPWIIPLFTCGTGLLTGWLVQRFIPETVTGGTDGTDATINTFHNKGGYMRPLVPVIKGFTSILTIASGGSAGREGPITQLGAGVGTWVASKFQFSAKERRILLLAGAAGGLGAVFRAPLGGALTAIEVVYREDFESEAMLPSIMSSVVAYSVFSLVYGSEPIFGIPRFEFHDPRELVFYALLAIVCAASGWLYCKTFYAFKYRLFFPLKDKIGLIWATGLGGLLMGLFGIFYPEVLSGGYGWLELAIMGQLPLLSMCAIIVGKTVATSLTIGSGLSGGMFAPALFVGGMSGGLVGKAGHHFFPDIVTQPGAYILVGMAAFFAGVANAPVGPLVMVTELTQGYGLLAPLMLASAICIVLSRSTSLYEHQVENKFDSPAHLEDTTINVLEQLHVSDVYSPSRVISLEENITLRALTNIIANSNQILYPVKNAEGTFTGILSIHDIRNWMFDEDLFDLVVVRDLATKRVYVRPDYDLYQALLRFVDTDYAQIPVVTKDSTDKFLGLLNREDVFNAYHDAMVDMKTEEAELPIKKTDLPPTA
ncbi:chloride channel protein [Pseudodesulfovibrio senegalensis]|uniref:Chloride channel protein n=1 Tax=Pseudodesulfovibrio senegalensis TaxID=1721087 RepID=A0A6N6N7F8_9BACT|nr:chloride channel protein [Pseudodesulfovibrio senegalensis]KAB1443017.1 chloride channel protein [Pseudodesulfovibrio senegalensis]